MVRPTAAMEAAVARSARHGFRGCIQHATKNCIEGIARTTSGSITYPTRSLCHIAARRQCVQQHNTPKSVPTCPSDCRTYVTRAEATASISRNTISIFRDVPSLRAWRKDLYLSSSGKHTLGLVPTMGALHAGHLSLCRAAAAENDSVAVSIYVNPTQFGVNEDLDAYPRTFDSDLAQLKRLNEELDSERARGRITAIFAPMTKTMYPVLPPSSEVQGHGSFVTITPLGNLLEGASRPVFFRGVATVCMKLFNIVRPERVYFGQKDIQQSVIIKRLVQDFHHDMQVRIVATQREADGLAMSSRNVYLGARRRKVSPVLRQALRIAEDQVRVHGKSGREDVLRPAYDFLDARLNGQMALRTSERSLFVLDYISLADPATMEELQSFDSAQGAILSGALKMLPVEESQPGEDEGEAGGATRPVRLIDNIVLESAQ